MRSIGRDSTEIVTLSTGEVHGVRGGATHNAKGCNVVARAVRIRGDNRRVARNQLVAIFARDNRSALCY